MRQILLLTASLAVLSLAACSKKAESETMTPESLSASDPSETGAETDNPLLADWSGPYGGVPAFDRMNVADVKPALEAGMAQNLAQVDEIASKPAPATFENTILALEAAGDDLGSVFTYYGILSSNMSTPEFRAVQQEMAPKLSEFNSKITQNDALFARVKAVKEGAEYRTLRADQKRLVDLVYDGFARNGATLEGEAKERYATINKRLAE